jgi:hypothetical protein
MIEENCEVMVEDMKSFTLFKEAMRKVGKEQNIRNCSSIIAKMGEIVIKYLKEQEKAERE